MKRLFLQIFAWLAILLGVGLMLQPTVSLYLTEQKSTKTVQKFVQAAEAAAPAAPTQARCTGLKNWAVAGVTAYSSS